MLFELTTILVVIGGVHCQNLMTLVTDHHIGGTFCKYLAWKMQIHHKTVCANPTCNWDSWQDALRSSNADPMNLNIPNLVSPGHSTHVGNGSIDIIISRNSSSEIEDNRIVASPSHKHHLHNAHHSTNNSVLGTTTPQPHKRSQQQRIIVSYGHNGFGNQLWEHTVAFMIAESLNARLLIGIIPDSMSPEGNMKPPNTWAGMAAMERLLPPEFLYENLPLNSSERQLCDSETFYLADRPRDWRNSEYSQAFKPNLYNLITDKNPRCLKMLGYFQNLPICVDDVRRLWTARMFSNFTVTPGPNDVSIYLRCVPRHYHFNDRDFYENILDGMEFDKVWLFQAPECPTKLADNPAHDGLVAQVMRLLTVKYNATKWPSAAEGSDDTTFLLHDLAGLAQSKKLILPVSSWAYWAGVLSSATEIHVNAPPKHPLMPEISTYVYHDDKAKLYFGKFNITEWDIIYKNDLSKVTSAPSYEPTESPTTQKVENTVLPTSPPISAFADASSKIEKLYPKS